MSCQKFIFKGYIIVVCLFLTETHSRCTTTFITTCEKVSDVSRQGKNEWKNLIISNDQCSKTISSAPNEILKPGGFQKTTNLEELFIIEKVNEIQPGAFNGLNQLTYLKLYKNRVKVIPRGAFSNLTQLFKLDLQDNSIENIEHGLFQDSSISVINLSYNKVNNIQVDKLDLPGLRKLIFTNNDISLMVSGCFHENLEYLNLDNNQIVEIEEGVLKPLQNLKELILSNNKLNGIEISFTLPNLEKLDLSHNEIQGIKEGSFKEFFELKFLYLGYNRITYLNPSVFPEDSNLQILHLHQNALMNLDERVGTNLPYLKEMSIGGNPWACPCLEVIVQYFDKKNIQQPECEREFFDSGISAVCWVTGDKCTGDEVLTTKIYNDFKEAIKTPTC
ncbi:hypothetical protein ILUMI_03698 [Ignelater luminosus]|uniref:Uncharacterized protein n=1 Tax=Ignelater luminosus TaxID=2038154 RepID=A0A8K0GF96_IGNLU|nr:hypothetical protein ILUMI_03698 [Ignelater luminosus]